MTKRFILILIACITPMAAAAPLPRTIAFYAVRPTDAAPKLDGRLDDACWEKAGIAATYYEYWKPDPGPGTLKTEFRMLYDERGVYVGVTNYDEHLDRLRAECVARNDPRLWTDDCAELFFDSEGKGVGFVRFAVNSLGTRGDMKRVDAAVVLNEWSGEQWSAVTGKTDRAWTVEAFFPWTDLGRKAGRGDLWRFTHIRFAYTSGKFEGITWAPGANYQATRNLGYLYFAGEGELSPEAVGGVLSQAVIPPWNLPLGRDVLTSTAPHSVAVRPAHEIVSQQRASLDELLKRAHTAAAGAGANDILTALAQCTKDVSAASAGGTAAEALGAIRSLAAAQVKAEELYWQSRVQELIGQTVISTVRPQGTTSSPNP